MSLIAGVLDLSAGSAVVATTAAPTSFNGGTPTLSDGSLCIIEGSIAQPFALGGQHYDADGRLGTDPLGAIVSYAGGIPLTAEGNVATAYTDPAVWVAGIPVTSGGRLSISLGYLLQENGFTILQEDGFDIRL